MHKRSILFLVGLTVFVGLFVTACDQVADRPDQTSSSGAQQVEDIFKVPENSKGLTTEQQNIWDRIGVTTDPTKVMWIHIITPLDAKIVARMPVRCEVTSSGKRLEPVQAASSNQYGSDYPEYKGFETNEIIQPDGTFGQSDNYIYWFDPMGRYHQLGTAGGLGYLLTDYPINLANPIDEITGLYNAHAAASKWQAEEEAKLRAKESK